MARVRSIFYGSSFVLAVMLWTVATGCHSLTRRTVEARWNTDSASDGGMSAWHALARQIEYPDALDCGLAAPLDSDPPRTMDRGIPTEFRDISLEEAIRLALENSAVLRDLGGRVLVQPESSQTVFDPAIVMSNPRTGEQAALSAFDAQLSETFLWQDSNRVFNNIAQGGGAFEVQRDAFRWNSQLSKTAATGTQFALRGLLDYDHNDAPLNIFNSAWFGSFEALVRQPLLQGAGTQFNQIAGPNASATGIELPGILLARVNTDVSLTQFERGIRDFVFEVEAAYWELYLGYQLLDIAQKARDSARETWQNIRARYDEDLKGGEADREAQAREQMFQFEQQVLFALDGTANAGGRLGLYARERQLRRLLGLPMTDNELLRPADDPTEARVLFDWDSCIADAMVRRVELRQQMWQIRRREMELLAAKNFLMPQLDLIAAYRVEGLGDNLIGEWAPFQSTARELLTFDNYEMQVGVQLNVPLGFRREFAGVRHAELNLSRERAILRDQGHAISQRLADAVAAVDTTHRSIALAAERVRAAEDVVDARESVFETRRINIDALLEAQRRLADARAEYFSARVGHVLAIRDVHLQKGTLLEYNGVELQEGPTPAAFRRKAQVWIREHSKPSVDYRFETVSPVSLGPFDPMIDLGGEVPQSPEWESPESLPYRPPTDDRRSSQPELLPPDRITPADQFQTLPSPRRLPSPSDVNETTERNETSPEG